RDIPLTLLVDDHEVDALDHQAADVREGDVPAFDRVVQPPVRILLNSARFTHGRLRHYGLCPFRSSGRLLHPILHRHVDPNSASFAPPVSVTSGRCAYRGVGSRRAPCRASCQGVLSRRSAPRTTSVTPCSASSTTTASW